MAPFRGQTVTVDGKTYALDLRFTRYYKPYTIKLKKFTHEIIPGTDLRAELRQHDSACRAGQSRRSRSADMDESSTSL